MEKTKKNNFNQTLSLLRMADEGFDDLSDEEYYERIGDVKDAINMMGLEHPYFS